MPITDIGVLYGLNDAKISALLTDAGAAPTYATALDVPGVTNLTMAAIYNPKELPGDGGIVAVGGGILGYDVECTFAMLPLKLLAVLQGGTVAETGTTPNQKTTYAITGLSTPPGYWKIEGIWNPGETTFQQGYCCAFKVKITEAPSVALNDANGDYATVTVKGKAIMCAGSAKQMWTAELRETAGTL